MKGRVSIIPNLGTSTGLSLIPLNFIIMMESCFFFFKFRIAKCHFLSSTMCKHITQIYLIEVSVLIQLDVGEGM